MIQLKKLYQNNQPLLVKVSLFCFIGLVILPSSWWENNWRSIQVNRALSDPRLSWEDRLLIFEKYDLQDEILVWQTAVDYLEQTSHYSHLRPSGQLFINPTFSNGLLGWQQYNGAWQLKQNNAFIEWHGEGHTSLSQTLLLQQGCYLFFVSGEVERFDETPNFWLYLERWVDDRPKGETLLRGTDSEILDKQMELFCLSEASQEITLAPMNVYGDVSVWLSAAYLFRLN